MEASVDIAGQELIVEYEFKITSRGCRAIRPSLSDPGAPAEGAEFEIIVHGARFPKQHADVPKPVLPTWLEDVIATHLMDRDDINDIVQDADRDPYYGRDPDYERDLQIENRELERQSQHDEF